MSAKKNHVPLRVFRSPEEIIEEQIAGLHQEPDEGQPTKVSGPEREEHQPIGFTEADREKRQRERAELYDETGAEVVSEEIKMKRRVGGKEEIVDIPVFRKRPKRRKK